MQTCVVHLIRNSFRYASKRDWPELAKDLKPIYTAPSEHAALVPLDHHRENPEQEES